MDYPLSHCRVSIVVNDEGDAKTSLIFDAAPLFPVDYDPPKEKKQQIADAIEYALDALVQTRPADALSYCAEKLKEYDEKFLSK
tara:strand:+ start:320 stop:571 length:252 start_codon:yes stop_codon:yes gene_type:complete